MNILLKILGGLLFPFTLPFLLLATITNFQPLRFPYMIAMLLLRNDKLDS